MSEVRSLKFPRQLFDAAPAPERALYLMASQLWNDVLILSRQMMICQTPADVGTSDAEAKARLAAQVLNLRMLASRLHEGKSFYTRLKGVLRTWKQDLPEEAVSAIMSLTRYFDGNGSPLSVLRRKIGFHSDYEFIVASLGDIGETHIEEFIGDTVLNTIFMSGETANIAALPSIVEGATAREALNRLTGDCLQAMEWTYDACQGYHRWFLNRYVLPHVPAIEDGPLVDLTDAPRFEELRFRFFANADGLVEAMTP